MLYYFNLIILLVSFLLYSLTDYFTLGKYDSLKLFSVSIIFHVFYISSY